MVYHDLNVPWTSSNDQDLGRTVAFLSELGYNTIALNHTISSKPPSNYANPIPENPFPSHQNLRILRRLTLVLSDTSQTAQLPLLAKVFDLIAIRPTSEKTLQQACSGLECDFISLDLSIRHPYHFKFKTLGLALSRGINFEICYSASLSDSQARRNLLSNAAALIRATKGKGIIISSEAKAAAGCRAPFDVANLACLWGLSQDAGMRAVEEGCRGLIVQAEMRRRSFRGVIDIVDGGDAVNRGKRKVEDVEEGGKGKGKDMGRLKGKEVGKQGNSGKKGAEGTNVVRPTKQQKRETKEKQKA